MASLITHHFASYFLLTLICSIFSTSIAEAEDEYTVKIHNIIPHTIAVHCMLNGITNLGRFTLDAYYSNTIYVPIYSDKENILWCGMWEDKKSGEFKLFDYSRDQSLCAKDKLCYWEVKYAGVCLRGKKGSCVLHYDWYDSLGS